MATPKQAAANEAAWAAANLLKDDLAARADGLPPRLYSNTAWHGPEMCDECGWPTVVVGGIAVVDFVRGYEDGGVLVQVTAPDGTCHEDETADYDALVDLAMALLDAALADEDE